MHDVFILDAAWKDIDRIADIHMALSGPVSAKKITDSILETIETLSVFPDGYPFLRDNELREQGYRMAVVRKYIIIYRVIDESVYVYHVADGRSDYSRIIK